MPNDSDISPETDAMNDHDENAQPESDSAMVTVPKAEIEALRQQIQDLKERMLRSQAEFENVKKRLRKEADDAGTRAVIRFVKPVLTELDNFTRAVNAANPEAFNEFASGVAMIRENLSNVLTNAGIEQIPSEGIFDPSHHEVIAEQERDDVPRGTIVDVHRAGYRLKDQLVRAAQVVVAKPPAE
jgi:molecular chaperone GrpE